MPATPTNASTSVLRTLHRIQRQLADLHERLDRGPRKARAAEANVQRCETALSQTKDTLQSLHMAVDRQQLQLRSGEDKVKELRGKLNSATNNREYQALLEQIAAAEMANSVLADEILEALEKVDAFQGSVVEAESTLVAAKQKAEQVHAEVAELEPSLQADLARVEAELRQSEATLPVDIRELYDRIVRQKGEDALAAVDNQCCDGCHQQVPLNLCSQIMLGKPVACKTCGRLLYLPE